VRKVGACRKALECEHEEGTPTSEPLSRSVTGAAVKAVNLMG
jgi:hypothetical protein